MSEWPGVFVSSTCYDLIDLRAELEDWIRDLGLIPVMSDRPTSEFEVTGYKDSITTCVENVRKCPVFICVLSNRYGPPLGKVGFDDISATHIEYRAARTDPDKRIIVYARDRLLGDFAVWRNAVRSGAAKQQKKKKKRKQESQVPQLPWVTDDRQYGIFELLHEHQKLFKDGDSNWVWPFTSSVDLKTRIALDLKVASRRANLARLIENDRVPLFALASVSSSSPAGGRWEATVEVNNMGPVLAMDVSIGFDPTSLQHLATAIAPGNHASQRLRFDVGADGNVRRQLKLRYSTPHGHRIEESHSFDSMDPGSYAISRNGRSLRLLDAPAFVIE